MRATVDVDSVRQAAKTSPNTLFSGVTDKFRFGWVYGLGSQLHIRGERTATPAVHDVLPKETPDK